MKLLIVFSILAIAIGANGNVFKEISNNKDMFLRIIECAQKAVVTGLPDIGLPSHDPLRISHNFSYSLDIGSYSVDIALENMYMEGIPWWNVTQFDDLSEKEENPVFNYTIYWKLMSFEGIWKFAIVGKEPGDKLIEEEGDFGFEFDHLTFAGIFNFSKPDNGDNKVGFNNLTLHLHTEESKLHFDDLGIVSTIIDALGGSVLKDVFNLDLLAEQLGPGIRDKLNNDWVGKPERIVALITNCGD